MERDAVTGKMKSRWALDMVLSCVMGRDDPVTVQIMFDTARKDRRERTYIAQPEDAKVSSRESSCDLNFCSTTFVTENRRRLGRSSDVEADIAQGFQVYEVLDALFTGHGQFDDNRGIDVRYNISSK